MNSTSISDCKEKNGSSNAYYSVGLSLGILLLITVISLISFYCSRRRNSSQQQNRHNQVTSVTANTNTNTMMELLEYSSLTIQILHQQPNGYRVLLYSEAKPTITTTASSSSCSICLEDYKDTDLVKLFPDCGHLFHRNCIDRWLLVNLSCPVCRNSPLPSPLAQATPLATRRY